MVFGIRTGCMYRNCDRIARYWAFAKSVLVQRPDAGGYCVYVKVRYETLVYFHWERSFVAPNLRRVQRDPQMGTCALVATREDR